MLGLSRNAFSAFGVVLYFVLFCLPMFIPVGVGSMSYIYAAVAGVVLTSVVMCFDEKRKVSS